MRILGMFLIVILGLATPLAFSESITDVIKNDGKFQFFDQSLLDQIESDNITEYPMKFFPISNESVIREDQINVISSLLISNYDAIDVIVNQNDIRPYVKATIPIDNLPLIAKNSFIGIITPINSQFNKDTSDMSISEQIKNNLKFQGFSNYWLNAIDNQEIDVLKIHISVAEQLFTNKIIHSPDVPKLVDFLKNIPNVKEENIFLGNNYVNLLLPINELPNVGNLDYVTSISSSTTGLKYLNSDKSKGIIKLSELGHVYDIPYHLTNGELLYFDRMAFDIRTSNDGSIELEYPRELIDQLDKHGILPMTNFTNNFSLEDLETKPCEYRKIRVNFSHNPYEISVFGLEPPLLVYGYALDWGTGIMKVYDEDIFQINTNNGEFEILTRQSGTVCSVDFISEEKKLKVIVKNMANKNNSVEIQIPNQLLSGEFDVFVDGISTKFDIVEKNTIHNTISLNPQTKSNDEIKIEIIGSELFSPPYALPTEFGQIINIENTGQEIKYVIDGAILNSIETYYTKISSELLPYLTHMLIDIKSLESGMLTITLPEYIIREGVQSNTKLLVTTDGTVVSPTTKIISSETVYLDIGMIEIPDAGILMPNRVVFPETVTLQIPFVQGTENITIQGITDKFDRKESEFNKTTLTAEQPASCFWNGLCPSQVDSSQDVSSNAENNSIGISGISLVNSFGKPMSGIYENQITQITANLKNNRVLVDYSDLTV